MDDTLVGQVLSSNLAKDLGLAALVSFAILSVLRGWLVPRATVRTLLEAKDKVISGLETQHAKDQETVGILSHALDATSGQNSKLIAGNEAANHYFSELARVTGRATPGTVPPMGGFGEGGRDGLAP